MALATLVLGLLAVWLVRRLGSRPARAALAVGLLTGPRLWFSSVNTWHRFLSIYDNWRGGFPADLRWLDKAAGGRR